MAAVWVAVGVNVPLLPCVPPATLLHTAANAIRGLEAGTVSAACQDSGITAHLAARVSMFHCICLDSRIRFSQFQSLFSFEKIATLAKILPYRAVHTERNVSNILFHH